MKTRDELLDLCHEDESIYAGSAYKDRLDKRIEEHERNDYSGTVYYRETDNMKKAENKLLKEKPGGFPYNIQQESNRQDGESGCVYVISGRKYRQP